MIIIIIIPIIIAAAGHARTGGGAPLAGDKERAVRERSPSRICSLSWSRRRESDRMFADQPSHRAPHNRMRLLWARPRNRPARQPAGSHSKEIRSREPNQRKPHSMRRRLRFYCRRDVVILMLCVCVQTRACDCAARSPARSAAAASAGFPRELAPSNNNNNPTTNGLNLSDWRQAAPVDVPPLACERITTNRRPLSADE